MAAVEIYNNLSFGLLDWRIYLFLESVSGQKAAASGQVFFLPMELIPASLRSVIIPLFLASRRMPIVILFSRH